MPAPWFSSSSRREEHSSVSGEGLERDLASLRLLSIDFVTRHTMTFSSQCLAKSAALYLLLKKLTSSAEKEKSDHKNDPGLLER
jgi:hypothetical protein